MQMTNTPIYIQGFLIAYMNLDVYIVWNGYYRLREFRYYQCTEYRKEQRKRKVLVCMELDNQEKMKQSMECGIYIFLYDSHIWYTATNINSSAPSIGSDNFDFGDTYGKIRFFFSQKETTI